jgi:hypothetical protein
MLWVFMFMKNALGDGSDIWSFMAHVVLYVMSMIPSCLSIAVLTGIPEGLRAG